MLTPEIRSLLKRLEEQGRAHDSQEPAHARKMLNLEPDTAEVVSILAQSARSRNALEIGTSNGYSTIWLAASIGPAGGRLISIDRNPDKQKMARANLVEAGLLDYVELRLGEASQVVSTLPGPFDFVLFDADRTSAPDQLKLLLPKLSKPALVLADNVQSHPQEIGAYLALVQSLPGIQHALIPVGKGLSVALV